MDVFLLYGGHEDELVVNGYIDAIFQSNKDYFKLQLGFMFSLNEYAIYQQMTILSIPWLSHFQNKSMRVILGQWVLDTCLIHPSSSKRLLVMCPKVIV